MSLISDFLHAQRACEKETGTPPREWIMHPAVRKALLFEVGDLPYLDAKAQSCALNGIPIRCDTTVRPLAGYRTAGGDTRIVHLSVPVAFL